MLNLKNYGTHAWHNSIVVWLLGSSPTIKDLHGKADHFGIQKFGANFLDPNLSIKLIELKGFWTIRAPKDKK